MPSPIIDLGVGDTLLRAMALGQQAANSRAELEQNRQRLDLANNEFQNRLAQQQIDNELARQRFAFDQQQWGDNAPMRAAHLQALQNEQNDRQAAANYLSANGMADAANVDPRILKMIQDSKEQQALSGFMATPTDGVGPPDPAKMAMYQGLPPELMHALMRQRLDDNAHSSLLEKAVADVDRLQASAMRAKMPANEIPVAIYNTLRQYPEGVLSEAVMSRFGLWGGAKQESKNRVPDASIDELVRTGQMKPEEGQAAKLVPDNALLVRHYVESKFGSGLSDSFQTKAIESRVDAAKQNYQYANDEWSKAVGKSETDKDVLAKLEKARGEAKTQLDTAYKTREEYFTGMANRSRPENVDSSLLNDPRAKFFESLVNQGMDDAKAMDETIKKFGE